MSAAAVTPPRAVRHATSLMLGHGVDFAERSRPPCTNTTRVGFTACASSSASPSTDLHFYVPGTKVPSTLPQILNHDELVRLFTVTIDFRYRAVLATAYAAGLRASELGRLQLTDIDSARMCVRVDQGKGTSSAQSEGVH